MSAAIVEVGKLLGVVADALAASVVVAVLFSLAVFGMTRGSERREQGSRALAYGALALLCLLACLAAATYGVVLIAAE